MLARTNSCCHTPPSRHGTAKSLQEIVSVHKRAEALVRQTPDAILNTVLEVVIL
jgi:hypothetical protein